MQCVFVFEAAKRGVDSTYGGVRGPNPLRWPKFVSSLNRFFSSLSAVGQNQPVGNGSKPATFVRRVSPLAWG